MKKFFLNLYFEPRQGQNSEKNSIVNLSTVESKIAHAKKIHESKISTEKTANATVLKDREYRRSVEFKKLLNEIKSLNETDFQKLNNSLKQEIFNIDQKTEAIKARYRAANWEIDYKKLGNDKQYQALNAQKLLLHEMRTTYGEARFRLENEMLKNKKAVAIASGKELDKLKWKNTVEHKDKGIDLKFDTNGTLSAKSLAGLMSNLDGGNSTSAKVEARNKFNFFSKNWQKYSIGEVQVFEFLSGKSKEELMQIYQRISGDFSSLDLDKNKFFATSDQWGEDTSKLNRELSNKLQKFRSNLITRTEIIADLSTIVSGNKDVRMGLKAVIDGTEQELLENLNKNFQDPEKVAKFLNDVKRVGVEKGDANYFQKVISVLMNIGINIATLGNVSVLYEEGEITADSVKKAMDLKSVSAKANVGETSSVRLNADLVGLSAEINWNDRETFIKNALAQIESQSTPEAKLQASKQMANIMKNNKETFALKTESQENKLHEKIIKHLDEFVSKQEEMVKAAQKYPNKLGDINKIMDQNTLVVLGRTEQEKGYQLKGVFANVNLSWYGLGLKAAKINTESTNEWLTTAATRMGYNAEEIPDSELSSILEEAWIKKVSDSRYLITNDEWTQEIVVPEGKKIVWDIAKTITPGKTIYDAVPRFVDKNDSSKNILSAKQKNDVIENNSQLVSDFTAHIKRTNPRNTWELQNFISNGNYSAAANKLEQIFRFPSVKKHPATSVLSQELNSVKNDPQKLYDFLASFLEKTSGGSDSRKLADKLEKWQNIDQELTQYYDKKVASAFAKQYGINKSEVMNIVNQVKSQGLKFNEYPSANAFGVMAFSQVNTGFRALSPFNNESTPIVGNAIDVTNSAISDKVLSKIKSSLAKNPKMLESIVSQDPSLKNATPAQITELLTSGNFKLKAVLSGVNNSECFNLGFMIEPELKMKSENTITVGDIVGRSKVTKSEFGIAWMRKWWSDDVKKEEKPKEQDNPKTKPDTPGQEPIPPTPDVPPVTPNPSINPGWTNVGEVWSSQVGVKLSEAINHNTLPNSWNIISGAGINNNAIPWAILE